MGSSLGLKVGVASKLFACNSATGTLLEILDPPLVYLQKHCPVYTHTYLGDRKLCTELEPAFFSGMAIVS